MIFETERLIVRKLILDDVKWFHKMQSNPKVMQFADGEVKSFEEHLTELKELINKYTAPNNDFWVYAIEQKINRKFIGTVAFVKDHLEDEIGYRFLEEFWNLGFGSEICAEIIVYCKQIKMKKIIAYVVDANKASAKILLKNNFISVHHFINNEQQLETKYELKL